MLIANNSIDSKLYDPITERTSMHASHWIRLGRCEQGDGVADEFHVRLIRVTAAVVGMLARAAPPSTATAGAAPATVAII